MYLLKELFVLFQQENYVLNFINKQKVIKL